MNIKITLKEKNNLLANATVVISTYDFGFITIKNFQIWKSKVYNERLQENINIQPPGISRYGHYFPSIFIENNQKWYEMEREIYHAYLDEKNKTNKKATEEINIDEIPI